MRPRLTILSALLSLSAILATSVVAQDSALVEQEALRVFLDCGPCDFDHFRREIPFVNYVRDRQDAEVHVLVRSQRTGGGGRAYEFDFIGLRNFAGRQDTLLFTSRQTDTRDEIRDGLLRTFMLGLMPFIAGSPLANDITISYVRPREEVVRRQPEGDPWNLWVFRIGGGGSISAESRTRFYSVNGSVTISKTTDLWRVRFLGWGRYSESRFELEEGDVLVSTSESLRGQASIVMSLGEHGGFGTHLTASRSTRVNQDYAVSGGPVLEFSVFPYSESTRRQLLFFYRVAVSKFDYQEVTLFGKTAETLLEHEVAVLGEAVQPWGSLHASAEASAIIDRPEFHRLELGGGFNVRVARGLDFNMFGSIARIKDQIYLPAADIPEEDILLQRRQLGTDFEVFANFGFSFTFGSIFNNVVNPRMDRIF